MDGTVRFASAAERAAFTAELMQAVTSLVAKYHDEQAEGGREHHLVVAVHPSVVEARPDAGRPGEQDPDGPPVRAARIEAEVPASPEEVWAAIATGPGIDSWFMGRSEVEPGAGRRRPHRRSASTRPSSPSPRWDPARRLAYGSGEAPDGRFIAYEFLIEGRAGGSTVLRAVTSGFLPGDDWAEEFEAMTARRRAVLPHPGRVPDALHRPLRGGGHRVRAAWHQLVPRSAAALPRARPGRAARAGRPGAVHRR